MVMNAKEEWIDRVMASLDRAGKAEWEKAGKERVLDRILHGTGAAKSLLPSYLLKAAAVILLLAGLNALTMAFYGKNQAEVQDSSVATDNDSFTYLNTYNL
jgi:hypothetical protein